MNDMVLAGILVIASALPGIAIGLMLLTGKWDPASIRAAKDPARARVAPARLRLAARIVAWPRTRLPSYTTAAWPAARPRVGASRSTCSTLPARRTRAGIGSPWARTWTVAGTDVTAGTSSASQTVSSPSITSTLSSAAGPTTTVFVAGRTSRT